MTIIKFNDYQCPFCARAHDTVKRILREYPGKVRFVFKQHPLPMHPQATIASEVALAAHEQGRVEAVHEKMEPAHAFCVGCHREQLGVTGEPNCATCHQPRPSADDAFRTTTAQNDE
mgnify:CR=1 FL=1